MIAVPSSTALGRGAKMVTYMEVARKVIKMSTRDHLA
jgi:hypothetical protein